MAEINTVLKVLLVDDDPGVLNSLVELFKGEYETIGAASGREAIAIARDNPAIAVAVIDIKMPDMDGVDTARRLREFIPDTPVIFHTGYPGDYAEADIEAKEKPFDYIVKGRSSVQLMRSVRNAAEAWRARSYSRTFTESAQAQYGLIGRSSAMQEVFRLIRQLSAADVKVMILGETGTGKELVARAIHQTSRRRDKFLGIVNCNHKTTELVEAELFGFRKWAFSGAGNSDRKGLFEIANEGTIFLDEIGDLSATTQNMLLRVLESGEFRQMGAEADVQKTDVRVICATHKNLQEQVSEGSFREDLYYRLKGAVVTLPPLRERREDIPLLVERFRDRLALQQELPYKVFEPDAINVLIEYSWPGNVRQLLDTIESLVVLTESELISADDIRRQLELSLEVTTGERPKLSERLKELERTFIIEALHEAGYSITAASLLLGLERTNLSKKIKSLGLDVSSLKDKK